MACFLGLVTGAQGLGQPHLCQKEKGAIEKAVSREQGWHSICPGGRMSGVAPLQTGAWPAPTGIEGCEEQTCPHALWVLTTQVFLNS